MGQADVLERRELVEAGGDQHAAGQPAALRAHHHRRDQAGALQQPTAAPPPRPRSRARPTDSRRRTRRSARASPRSALRGRVAMHARVEQDRRRRARRHHRDHHHPPHRDDQRPGRSAPGAGGGVIHALHAGMSMPACLHAGMLDAGRCGSVREQRERASSPRRSCRGRRP